MYCTVLYSVPRLFASMDRFCTPVKVSSDSVHEHRRILKLRERIRDLRVNQTPAEITVSLLISSSVSDSSDDSSVSASSELLSSSEVLTDSSATAPRNSFPAPGLSLSHQMPDLTTT